MAVHSTGHQRVTAGFNSSGPQHGLAPPCSLDTGLGVQSWCSRFGAILVKSLVEPWALDVHFTKQWGACWGCVSLYDITQMPCALLCPPRVGPSSTLGVAHPHLSIWAEGSHGNLCGVQVQNHNRPWKPRDGAGKRSQALGTRPKW